MTTKKKVSARQKVSEKKVVKKVVNKTGKVSVKASTKTVDPNIESLIKKGIDQAKKLLKDGCSKAEAAREIYDFMSKMERKHVIQAFIDGCGLTKAGSATYYQNIKNGK